MMSLSEELVKRLENLPPPEPRSRLEPLRELILAWRQQAVVVGACKHKQLSLQTSAFPDHFNG
jgi:hypothetical protein